MLLKGAGKSGNVAVTEQLCGLLAASALPQKYICAFHPNTRKVFLHRHALMLQKQTRKIVTIKIQCLRSGVTRQELAGFMMNLAGFLDRDITAKADISGFADAAKVPGWAREYMEWAVGVGLISGRESGGVVYLASADNAVRTELASMIMDFMTR